MKRRFRWKRLVQIRLATLLILVTLCAAGLGFRQSIIVPYQRQDAAVQPDDSPVTGNFVDSCFIVCDVSDRRRLFQGCLDRGATGVQVTLSEVL